MEFPTFNGRKEESGRDFVDSFELSCLLVGRDVPAIMLKLFPLALRGKAREWYASISKHIKEDWSHLRRAFLDEFSPKDTPEEIWEKLQQLRQDNLCRYVFYESNFLALLQSLDAVWGGEQRVPEFLIKEIFLNGLFKSLKDKVCCKFPSSFNEAIEIARTKHRRLMYPLHTLGVLDEVIPLPIDHYTRSVFSPCVDDFQPGKTEGFQGQTRLIKVFQA